VKVSAVIPSRGDVDLKKITDHLRRYPEIDEVLLGISDTPHTRYRMANIARNEIIFTQDDDCLTDLRPLIEAYEPAMLVNAMTPEHAAQYPGRQTLIGFGALFQKSLTICLDGWERDALFYRESDRIFATLNPHKTVFPSIQILPQAHNPNRFWKQPDHVSARLVMEKRIFLKTGVQA